MTVVTSESFHINYTYILYPANETHYYIYDIEHRYDHVYALLLCSWVYESYNAVLCEFIWQVCYVSLLAGWQNIIQKDAKNHEITWLAIWHLLVWPTFWPGLILLLHICSSVQFFYNSSWPSPLYFTSLDCSFIISWNTCSLLVTNICPFIALFFFLCLLLLIIIYLFMVLSIFIVYVGCLSNGISCWIYVDGVEYLHQWICFYVRVFIRLVL